MSPKLTAFQLKTLRRFLAHERTYAPFCKDGWVSAASFRSPTILALRDRGLVETRGVSYTYQCGGMYSRTRFGSEILARSTEAGRLLG